MNREKKINDIMKYAKGGKIEKHYLRFLKEDGSPVPNMPVEEINSPFDVVVQFVDFRKKTVTIEGLSPSIDN
jgi:hypothetical protein